jgi:hypothetical protein
MTANSTGVTKIQQRLTNMALLALVFFVFGSLAHGQSTNVIALQTNMHAGGSASGTLTVTAIVVTSVGLIIGPDGEPKLVVANAVDAGDNFSRLATARDNTALSVKTSGKCEVNAGQASASCGELTVQPRTNVTSAH